MHFTGTFSTNGNTGNRSITGIGFEPSYIRLTLSQHTTLAEPFIHLSEGYTDGTHQSCHSLFQDNAGARTSAFTNRVISHMNRVGGVITDQIAASFVSFDPDGFTLNFSAAAPGYKVHVEAFE